MSADTSYAFVEEELEARRRDQRLRVLRSLEPGPEPATVLSGERKFVNFSSNDYLGLSRHPEVRERSSEFAARYGAGSTASRLVTGTYEIHTELEEKLARFFNRPACLMFNSGFQANSSILGSLTSRHSLILADRLSHNSLLQGALGSRAELRRYDHNDAADLERQLERAGRKQYDRVLIVTESIFSMDGDRAPLEEIGDAADRHNAILFVDDAHATGVWGRRGRGLAPGIGSADLILGTFGKAFGVFGAYLLCGKQTREYMVNVCPGFIYTTALPPAVVGGIDASLELMPDLESRRNRLHHRIRRLRESLRKLGYDTGASDSQILPLVTGGEDAALDLARHLEEGGILAPAIRPPTVPDNSSRIRLSLSASHSEEQLERLYSLLEEWKNG